MREYQNNPAVEAARTVANGAAHTGGMYNGTGFGSIGGAIGAVLHGNLQVTPEVLDAKAHTVSAKIAEMRKQFEEMERAVNKTKNYWVGEAGDAHRERYNSKKEEIEKVFKRWDEEVSDMFLIKETYATAEREAAEVAADLPSDVII